jgi:hypothetical protein
MILTNCLCTGGFHGKFKGLGHMTACRTRTGLFVVPFFVIKAGESVTHLSWARSLGLAALYHHVRIVNRLSIQLFLSTQRLCVTISVTSCEKSSLEQLQLETITDINDRQAAEKKKNTRRRDHKKRPGGGSAFSARISARFSAQFFFLHHADG